MDSDNMRLSESSKKNEKTTPAGTSAVSHVRTSKRSGRVRIINELKPFLPLLPDVAEMNKNEQQELFQQLYSAGIAASASLHKNEKDLCTDSDLYVAKIYNMQLSSNQQLSLTLEDVEALKTLSRSGILDDAVESLRQYPSLEEDLLGLKDDVTSTSLVTPDIAAAALSAFAAATLRRPPSRTIENMMASSQDPVTANGGPDSTDDESLELNLSDDESEDNGDMLLNLAVSAGYLDLTKGLVGIRGNPNYSSVNNDRTPLMEACCAGHTDIVKHLLEHGADVNAVSATKNTPVIYASAAGNLECVKLLLNYKCNLSLRNENGHCALMEAASSGYLDVVSLLVERGAQLLPCNHNELKVGLESALTLAAYKGHYDVVQYLLAQGANKHKEELHTALMEASMDGHYDVARLLLDSGAPVNLASDSFESPLTLAACGGHTDLVQLLLESGAVVEEVNDEGYTPLMEASREGHVDVAKLLIQFGAKVNTQTDETGETALTLAACGGFRDVVELLVRSDARLDIGANTPLMEAAQEGHLETVKFILQEMRSFGLSVDATTTANSNTALTYAAENGHLDVCAALIESGADIDHQAENGRTALMKAAKNGNYSVIQFLLMRGAKVNEVSTDNDASALSLACAHGHWEIVRLLLDHGADPSHVFKDGMTCMIEASRNGHTRVAETLLNWHDVPVVTRAPILGKPPVLQGNRLKKVARRTANKKATAAAQPKVERAEKSVNNMPTNLEEELSDLTGMMIAAKGTSAILNHDSEISSSTHNTAKNKGASHHLHTHCNYQQVLNPDELRGMIAGMAAMAAQSNALPNDHLFAQIAGKALRGTFANSEISGSLSDKKMHQQFSELLKQQFSILASRQKDALAGLGNSLPDPESENVPLSPPKTHHPSGKQATSAKQKQSTNQAAEQRLKPEAAGVQPLADKNVTRGRNRRTLSESAMHAGEDQHAEKQVCNTDSDDEIGSRSDVGNGASQPFNVDMQTESNHDTALTLAATGGHDTLVELLITRGADIEHKDKKGFTPLILAATGGHVSVVELLLNHGANIEAQSDRTKDTALSLACSGGRKEVVELLLKRGANKEHRNVSDYTPLSLAASGGYVDIVNLLLNNGAEINSRTGSKLGISPLMLAAMNGHSAATKLLLERGSDINSHIETNRNTALTLACFQGRTEVVRLLLEYNANVEHRAKTGLTPLMEAANGGYVEVGELLLAAGADPNTAPVPTSRDTALTIAADKGHHKFVEMLIHARAQIDAKNKKGCSALWLACHGGHLETVQTLVKHDADVDAQDNRHVSPLIIAFRRGHIKVVKYMVRHVQQFPSDTDCYRFIATVNDKELLTRCHLCMDIIVAAKDRQAAEANRAAESLLEILAKEEAQAKSKKLSKQRQNEKKKAKRRAKKNQAESNIERKDAVQKEEATRNNSKEISVEENNSKKDSADALTGNESGNCDLDAEADPPRVPLLLSDEQSDDEAAVSPPESSPTKHISGSSASSSNEKAARHRTRKESGNASGKSTSAKSSPSHKTGCVNSSDTEWMKATSKRNAGKGTVAGKNIASGTGTTAKEDTTATWRHTDSACRYSAKLSVSSTSIARVIGRAGGNINAIREATGAYIEVEKQSGKKEQHDRQITLKGTDIALKQAVDMIHGLIDDSECNVEEVIQRVSSAHNMNNAHPIDEITNRSNALSVPRAITPSTTVQVKKPIPLAAGPTVASNASHEETHTLAASSKTVPQLVTTNVWAQRAAQRQGQKVISAIGSEKKQKMSSIASEQEMRNADQFFLKAPGLRISQETSDEMQKRGVKEFCRTPGHARPSSASASSASVSPVGLTPPLHIPSAGGAINPGIGESLATAGLSDFRPRAEAFETVPKIEFSSNIPTTAPLSSVSHVPERKIQPFVGVSPPNTDTMKAGSNISDKLFPTVDTNHQSIFPSIAKIWDDNIVDEKSSWAIPTRLTAVPLEDFARNINVQLPTPVNLIKESPNSVVAEQAADLTKNISTLRTIEDRSLNAASSELMTRRNFLTENTPPFDLSAPFPSHDPIDWSSMGAAPPDTFPRWRNNHQEPITGTPASQDIDSSSWIDQVAARLASTRQERAPFPSVTSYGVPSNLTHVPGTFGAEASNMNLSQQQQQPSQAWNRMHFQQAAQAASNEYENLTNLLSSYRPTVNSQHQHQPPHMPLGTVNYNSASVPGPAGYPVTAPRSQIANTSVPPPPPPPPPPPFFNSHIPPPPSMSHRGVAASHTPASMAWPSMPFGAQAQTNNVAENTQFSQLPNTTRGNWNYNW